MCVVCVHDTFFKENGVLRVVCVHDTIHAFTFIYPGTVTCDMSLSLFRRDKGREGKREKSFQTLFLFFWG